MSECRTHWGNLFGYVIHRDEPIGHLWVEHDGKITWDQLQAIKNAVWGTEARAVEIYPATSQVVNSINCRHLWRLGQTDFAPDLLGDAKGQDSLQARFSIAWSEARGAFK